MAGIRQEKTAINQGRNLKFSMTVGYIYLPMKQENELPYYTIKNGIFTIIVAAEKIPSLSFCRAQPVSGLVIVCRRM